MKDITRTHCIAFDLSSDVGIANVRACSGRQFAGVYRPSSVEVLGLDVIELPTAEDDEFRKKDSAVKARVHSAELWSAVHSMFRVTLLEAFSKAHANHGGNLIVAYEKVVFASSVFWAQFYGGLIATLMHTINDEFRNQRAKITTIGVNVSKVKSMLTGDSGAPKDLVAEKLEPYLERATRATLKRYEQIPAKKRHNATDALSVALAAMQIVHDTCEPIA